MKRTSRHLSKITMTAMTIILAISTNAIAQNQIDGMPEWFVMPPADTEEYLYSVSSGDTYSEALSISLQSMAGKLETKVEALNKVFEEEIDSGDADYSETFSSSAKSVMNQSFGNINIQGMQKMFEEELSTGYKSTYENVVRILYKKSETEIFQIDLYQTEVTGPERSKYVISEEKFEAGASFEDMLNYIDGTDILTVKMESVPKKTGHTYFVQLGLSVEESRKAMEIETARQDSILYEKFKRSKAYEELQKNLDKSGSDEDDQ